MMPRVREVVDIHKQAIVLFGKCHNGYNGGVVSDEEIDTLGITNNNPIWIQYEVVCFTEKDIEAFMAHYRKSFPDATVLPKMHILEDHVIPWVRQKKIGSGLMGEQGAESIHSHIYKLEAQYRGVVNPLQRLKYVVNEHNIEVTPTLNMLRPPSRKKAKNSD